MASGPATGQAGTEEGTLDEVLRGAAIGERLDALSALLVRGRPIWAVAPFRAHRPPWVADHPGIAAWLEARTPDEVRALEEGASPDEGPDAWRALVRETDALARIGALVPEAPVDLRDPLARRVKGRKWTQVDGFLRATGPALARASGPVVEWCSGRGHLGRTLAARLGHGALLLERDPHLCAPPDGRAEAPDVRHVTVDVLAPGVGDLVPPHAALVGLHACGTLTDRLIDVALARGADAVAAAPCCPHRLFDRPSYQPASARARAAGLPLGPDELHLAVLDEVVVRPRRRQQRERELVARVALDLLAREATGRDVHHGFPTVDRALFDRPLVEVAAHVAAAHGLPLPARWDPDAAWRRGEATSWRIRAYGAARVRFRRPLETWLVLDRAERLREAGLDVVVGTFCPREASPRNLLIRAVRPGPGGEVGAADGSG